MKLGVKFFLIFNLFFVAQCFAACTRYNDVPAGIVYIDMGTVIVNPNLNVGDVIAEKSFPFGEVGVAFYCYGGDMIEGAINTSLFISNNNKVYQTNVSGVGIKIARDRNIYPYNYVAQRERQINVVAGNIIVTLYKTAEFVGSGPLSSGNYTSYGIPGATLSTSALSSYMTEGGTSIVTPSCSVVSGAEQNVYLEPVSYTKLKTVGATTGDTNFAIRTRCSGGGEGVNDSSGYSHVYMTFSGTIPSNLSNSDGVLVNDISSNGATGIGIQVLDSNKQALVFEKKYNAGSLALTGNYFYTFNYTARYYRYGNNIMPGAVESKMIFNITYE
ncbi:fimbrial protein [Orbus sturtevantii]|uniref:fimbrial protein n=1 Tax=Orbus sturtevantii TaxID=3074109 RepID=UPI00370D808C